METFRFKQFSIRHRDAAMKVGTDGVLLGAWASIHTPQKILDIGTGTGLIALMLAQRFPLSLIDAIEIDEDAYQEALLNAASSPFTKQVSVYHASLSEWIKYAQVKYDLIVCNPPYFDKGYVVQNEKRKKARVASALPPAELIEAGIRLSTEDGSLSLILPPAEADQFMSMAENTGLFCRRHTDIYSKPGKQILRKLIEISKMQGELMRDSLVIEGEGQHAYTDAYKALTRDFYLHF